MKELILEKIDKREIVVGVIGLGYVGLPLAVEKAKAGFRTIGFDIQKSKVDSVNRSENYIGDVVGSDLDEVVKSGMLSATTDFSFVKDVEFIAICVPTPLDSHQQPNITYVKASAESVSAHMKKGAIVVLESTTYPGTTEELLKPILEQGSGLVCGVDFYLGFSPERVDPGNLIYKTKNTPKVVGAVGRDALDIIAHMYRAVLDSDVFEASSTVIAEMEKLLENTYRNVNIGLINEFAILCNTMGINVWEVIEAAKTKPYGFTAFYPGPGVGGHCIPLDPYYLSWKAREFGFHTSMIEASMMINDRMPAYCVERISKMLNRYKKPLNGSKILVLGVAYKQDVDDYRESPALRLISHLEDSLANVDFYDPYIQSFHYNGKRKDRIMVDIECIKGYDIIVLATAHTRFDYPMFASSGVPIFDTKNAFRLDTCLSEIEVL